MHSKRIPPLHKVVGICDAALQGISHPTIMLDQTDSMLTTRQNTGNNDKFPEDVLLIIFEEHAAIRPPLDHRIHPIFSNILGVCRFWRDLGLSNPHLWWHIRVEVELEYHEMPFTETISKTIRNRFALHLARSRGRADDMPALDISINFLNVTPRLSNGHLREALREYNPPLRTYWENCHREGSFLSALPGLRESVYENLTHLRLLVEHPEYYFWPASDQEEWYWSNRIFSFPNLQLIHILMHSTQFYVPNILFERIQAPKLSTLRLISSHSITVDVDHLARVAQNYPQLRDLVLDTDSSCVTDVSDVIKPTHSVRNLTIFEGNQSTFLRLLNSFPNTQHLTYYDFPAEFKRNWQINFRLEIKTLTLSNSMEPMVAHYGEDKTLEVICRFLQGFNSLECLEIGPSKDPTDTVHFDWFPRDASNSPRYSEIFIEAIMQALEKYEGGVPVLCPNLQKIQLNLLSFERSFLTAILDYLRVRSSDSSSSHVRIGLRRCFTVIREAHVLPRLVELPDSNDLSLAKFVEFYTNFF